MTEETKKKAPAKTAAPKAEKPAAKKEAAPKAAAKAEPKKAAPAKATPSGKTITLVQTGSPIGREQSQRATLIGLGLNKIGRSRTLQDTPAVRGMVAKVMHLITVTA